MNMRERMGSGGLRRLQISRSGASRVRGGFDSHALPPLLALMLAASLLAVPASAKPAAAPPGAGARDSAALASPDSTGSAAAAARRSANRFSEQPRAVMLRSLVVPGWGQAYNHAWFKAVGVAGTEGWLISSVLHDRSQLNGLRDQANAAAQLHDEAAYIAAVNRYNSRLDGYVGGQWLLGGLLAYALIDAYVDAHFRRFELEFQSDPALPRDIAPEDGRGGAPPGDSGGRLSLRWHF